MPCYEVRTMSVEFKAEHVDLLKKALDFLGITQDWNVARTFCRLDNGIELDLRTGKATIGEGQQAELNQLKRAYSMEAIKQVAARNHWKIEKKSGTKGQFTKSLF